MGPAEIPPDTLAFMTAFRGRLEAIGEDRPQLHQFLKAHLESLNDDLLKALPLIFAEWIQAKTRHQQNQIASVFGAFGNVVTTFPLGNRALNLELSIAAYERALQVRTRDDFPQDWATTQICLGVAYKDRIRGDRAENIEQAITAYGLALQVRTREDFPQDWAMTQNNLANAYADRIRGDRAENIERAISASERALQVRTRDDFPQNWAQTQNNLANAYKDRIRGDRAENIEKAIASYERALQVLTRDDFPQDWAMTQHNLGNAYRESSQGQRLETLEKAIAAYEKAAQIFTRDSLPEQWAENQGYLVSALLEQFKLTQKTADLDAAIAALQEAGTVASVGTDSYVWIYYTLGTALDYRYSLRQDPDDLANATISYGQAAAATPWANRKLDYHEKAGDSRYQLGVALTQDGQWYEGLAQLEASLETYRQAQNRLGRADALQQIARTHYLMGNFDKARVYFRDALRLYQAEAHPPGEAACRAGLGRLLLRLNFVDDAIAELNQACDQYRALGDDTRLANVQDTYELAQKLAQKLAQET
jgi:tetratricopeptide (TPR) repeat protein